MQCDALHIVLKSESEVANGLQCLSWLAPALRAFSRVGQAALFEFALCHAEARAASRHNFPAGFFALWRCCLPLPAIVNANPRYRHQMTLRPSAWSRRLIIDCSFATAAVCDFVALKRHCHCEVCRGSFGRFYPEDFSATLPLAVDPGRCGHVGRRLEDRLFVRCRM